MLWWVQTIKNNQSSKINFVFKQHVNYIFWNAKEKILISVYVYQGEISEVTFKLSKMNRDSQVGHSGHRK